MARRWARSGAGGGTASSTPLAVAHSSIMSSKRPSLRSARSHLLRNEPGELGAAVADPGELADQLHADAGQRVEVERGSLRRARRAASKARGGRARCRPPRRSARRARPPPPSTIGCRARGRDVARERARRRPASPAGPSAGSRARSARRSPTRRPPARRLRRAASGLRYSIGVSVVTDAGTAPAKAGNLGTLNAPDASTTVSHRHSP